MTQLTPQALLAIAHQRRQAGDLLAAENFSNMVLEKHPDYREAWLFKAQLAELGGKAEELATALAKVERHSLGASAAYLTDMGNLYRSQRQHAEAGKAYRRAVETQPDYAQGWNNLGVNAHERGDNAAAEAAYLHALALAPDLALAHNNYAALRHLAGDLNAASQHYRLAIELDPGYAVAWKNYGSILQEQGRHAEAMHAYDQAAQHRLHYADAISGSLYMRLHLLEWDGLSQQLGSLSTALQHDKTARISPFVHMAVDSNPATQQQISQRWAGHYTPQPLPSRTITQGKRIRLGYVGADFFAHATSWLTAGMFAAHDRTRFEVWGYDYGLDDNSAVRNQISNSFDRFTQVHALDAEQLAQRLRDDEIDILIDLKGWTRNSRSQVMAWRPAPVQVHYLAYPGTLGADWCDYLIADKQVIPPGTEQYYNEAVVRLPHCYQINARLANASPTPGRQAVGLPETGFVFCCFNQHYKLLPAMFDLWMQLLQQVPGSVLWLLATSPHNCERLQQEAHKRGIAPNRLVFAPPLAQAEHLARLALADLALDTLPCNAHTTASDALWAGVPLLTCVADSFASRVAASCLHAIGLPELITTSLPAYQALALQLATEPAQLAALRTRLADNRANWPLFDSQASIAALERAYEAMWARQLAGLPPAGFDLP